MSGQECISWVLDRVSTLETRGGHINSRELMLESLACAAAEGCHMARECEARLSKALTLTYRTAA